MHSELLRPRTRRNHDRHLGSLSSAATTLRLWAELAGSTSCSYRAVKCAGPRSRSATKQELQRGNHLGFAWVARKRCALTTSLSLQKLGAIALAVAMSWPRSLTVQRHLGTLHARAAVPCPPWLPLHHRPLSPLTRLPWQRGALRRDFPPKPRLAPLQAPARMAGLM